MRSIFVVLSSHLDREWYATCDKFRILIAQIMQRAIELTDNSESQISFMLDGQTIVLDDYLEIYPDNISLIKKLVNDGKLIIGPWYVQPDEFLIDGESLIRNLRLGIQKARQYGEYMRIGYLPDSFGHISQMPQILNGFGIDKAFIMRGIDNNETQEFFWEAPDGTSVKLIHNEYANCITMDLKNMENGVGIISDSKMLKERFDQLYESTNTSSQYLLATIGGDHLGPPINFNELLYEVQSESVGLYRIITGSLDEYFRTIDWNQIFTIRRGELRNSKDIKDLNDVAAARSYLKKRNQEVENKILRQAEVVVGSAFILGYDTLSEFLPKAWELLLQNHTHDGICGCCNDNVHKEMMVRFQKAEDIADLITTANLEKIAAHINIPDCEEDDKVLLIFNGNGVGFNGFIEAEIIMPNHRPEASFVIINEHGNIIPYQVCKTYMKETIKSDIDRVQQFQKLRITKIVFYVDTMDAIGYRAYKVRFSDNVQPQDIKTSKQNSEVNVKFIENAYIKAEFFNNGTISVTDKDTGHTYSNMHYFVDEGSIGDVYQYIKPVNDKIFDSRDLEWNVEVIEEGPYIKSVNMSVPFYLPLDMDRKSGERSPRLVRNDIRIRADLYADSKLLRFKTQLTNRAKNHRLRLLFSPAIKAEQTTAGSPFFIENRGINQFPFLHPFQKFVDIRDESRGFSFFSRGLFQYQLIQDDVRTLAITLLRSEDVLYHWAFDKNMDFSEAQCLGENVFEYAFYVHNGIDKMSFVYKEATKYNTNPMVYFGCAASSGSLNMNKSIIDLNKDDCTAISAIKIAEDKKNLEIRVFNLSQENGEVKLTIGSELEEALLTDLLGQHITELNCDKNTVIVKLDAHKIASLKIKLYRKNLFKKHKETPEE